MTRHVAQKIVRCTMHPIIEVSLSGALRFFFFFWSRPPTSRNFRLFPLFVNDGSGPATEHRNQYPTSSQNIPSDNEAGELSSYMAVAHVCNS